MWFQNPISNPKRQRGSRKNRRGIDPRSRFGLLLKWPLIMFESPRWLTTLLRVREHRRDMALQSLAQSLQTANAARDSAESVANAVSSLTKVQQRDGSVGRVDVARLRQLRQTRDELRTELTERHRQQTAAD